MYKYCVCTVAAVCLYLSSIAQTGNISVDHFTGALNVTIPLYSVSSGSLTMPVALIYSGNGVRVKDKVYQIGMNWKLVAGGEVSRKLNGLPDDIKINDANPDRTGWLYSSNGTKINNFNITNDNSTAVCTDETADNSYITGNFGDLSDTEPDVFSVSAPGLSCSFIFDGSHNIRLLGYQDVKISYQADNSTGRITSFAITNDKGVTYTFAERDEVLQTITASGSPVYFKRYYDLNKQSLNFDRFWKLSKIADGTGGEITLTYSSDPISYQVKPVSVVLPGTNSASLQYTVRQIIFAKRLQGIWSVTSGDIVSKVLDFNWTNADKKISGLGKTITLHVFQNTLNGQPQTTGNDRIFLQRLDIEGGSIKRNYRFHYFGETTDPTGGGLTGVNLPDSTSSKQDLWGYYNGSSAASLVPQTYINPGTAGKERYRHASPGVSASSYLYTLNGADRSPNIGFAVNGSLSNMSSNLGDTTFIEYELNNYYDNTAGAVINGGGLRVKKLTANDGFNTSNSRVTNYSYVDPATGLSSGRPVNLPVNAFTTPYTGTGTAAALWANSTVLSENDLSEEDEHIIYKNVSVSKAGTGTTRYEYSVPGTYWDATATPDWNPTIYYSGRISCSAATWSNNQTNNYPFSSNPNFDFERGLLQKVSTYNEAGQLTGDETYAYQRSFLSPFIVTGLKFDYNTSSARNYAKYSFLTGTSKLLITQTKRLFDLPSLSTSHSSSVTFSYASTAHKQITSTETVNSDGSVAKTSFKYVKDYSTVPGADSMANSLYRLKQKNVNTLVEQYRQVTRGGVTRTTGAGLTLYKNFYIGFDRDLPVQTLNISSVNGLLNFSPSGIQSNAFVWNPAYVVQRNFIAYDPYGVLQTSDDNRHNLLTVLTDPTSEQGGVSITGALAGEFAVEDFDTPYPEGHLTYSDTTKSLNARTGNYAMTFKSSSNVFRIMKRNALASNYIFSVWINSSSSGTLTIRLTDGTTTYNYPLNYSANAGKWKYYEIKTPLGSLAATFTLKLLPSADILLDDVLFYPEQSAVSTAIFDQNTRLMTSKTNANGVSSYYAYDGFGRLKTVFDQDKNIIQQKSYADFNAYDQFDVDFYAQILNATSDSLNYNNSIVFRNLDQSDLPGYRWTWNFGDGTAPVTITQTTPVYGKNNTILRNYGQVNHTYTAKGDYQVTLTKFSPMPGNKTITKTVHITDNANINIPLFTLGRQGAQISNVLFSGTGSGKQQTPDGLNFTVGQGLYTVNVYASGSAYNSTTGNGFKIVYLKSGNDVIDCQTYHSNSSIYTFYGVDLNGKSNLSVILSELNCTDVAPPGNVSLTTPPPTDDH